MKSAREATTNPLRSRLTQLQASSESRCRVVVVRRFLRAVGVVDTSALSTDRPTMLGPIKQHHLDHPSAVSTDDLVPCVQATRFQWNTKRIRLLTQPSEISCRCVGLVRTVGNLDHTTASHVGRSVGHFLMRRQCRCAVRGWCWGIRTTSCPIVTTRALSSMPSLLPATSPRIRRSSRTSCLQHISHIHEPLAKLPVVSISTRHRRSQDAPRISGHSERRASRQSGHVVEQGLLSLQ